MAMRLRKLQELLGAPSDLKGSDHKTISGEMRLTQSSKVSHIKSLKEGGHYFPQRSGMGTSPTILQVYVNWKLSEISIHCNMLSGSIFDDFFKSETYAPKTYVFGRIGPKFKISIFEKLSFLSIFTVIQVTSALPKMTEIIWLNSETGEDS